MMFAKESVKNIVSSKLAKSYAFVETITKDVDSNKKILGGGKDLVLTAEQYKNIVEKIKSIRNSFTLTK